MNKKKEILKCCRSILFVGTFLCLSTVFIFLPNNKELVGALSYLDRIDSVNVKSIAGNLSLEYNFPVSDTIGKETNGFNFQVENISSKTSDINITFLTGNIDDENKLDNSSVKYMLYKDNELVKDISVLEEDSIILTDELNGNDSNNYTLKFWINSDTEQILEGKTFEANILVDVIK